MNQKHGAEHTTYAAADLERVLRVLNAHVGRERAATEQRLAHEAGMPERRFRAILTEHDGVSWLVGKCNRSGDEPGGLFLASSAAEASSLSAEIASKIGTLGERQRRRDEYAARLGAPLAQGRLFGATEVAA